MENHWNSKVHKNFYCWKRFRSAPDWSPAAPARWGVRSRWGAAPSRRPWPPTARPPGRSPSGSPDPRNHPGRGSRIEIYNFVSALYVWWNWIGRRPAPEYLFIEVRIFVFTEHSFTNHIENIIYYTHTIAHCPDSRNFTLTNQMLKQTAEGCSIKSVFN